MNKVFAYGSLRPPGKPEHERLVWNWFAIHWHVLEHTRGTVQGTLRNLGRFPGAMPGSGTIHGDVITMTDAGLSLCDQIEGHPDFYKRELVTVQTDEGPVEAWIYWAPDRAKGCPVVEGGDWLNR